MEVDKGPAVVGHDYDNAVESVEEVVEGALGYIVAFWIFWPVSAIKNRFVSEEFAAKNYEHEEEDGEEDGEVPHVFYSLVDRLEQALQPFPATR